MVGFEDSVNLAEETKDPVRIWLVNYLVVGRVNFDPTHVDDSRNHPRNPMS